jgi:hypothetical protein
MNIDVKKRFLYFFCPHILQLPPLRRAFTKAKFLETSSSHLARRSASFSPIIHPYRYQKAINFNEKRLAPRMELLLGDSSRTKSFRMRYSQGADGSYWRRPQSVEILLRIDDLDKTPRAHPWSNCR